MELDKTAILTAIIFIALWGLNLKIFVIKPEFKELILGIGHFAFLLIITNKLIKWIIKKQ